jgi:hypothetical protein
MSLMIHWTAPPTPKSPAVRITKVQNTPVIDVLPDPGPPRIVGVAPIASSAHLFPHRKPSTAILNRTSNASIIVCDLLEFTPEYQL